MKVICTQENLKEGLGIISRIIGNSSTLPILNNVLLETKDGSLTLSGTNLEVGMSTSVRCKTEQEGSVCLNYKTFSDLINSLSKQTVTIEVSDIETVISTERTNTKLKHSTTDEFPVIPDVENGQVVEVDSNGFKEALEQVVFAASTSETQPEISGVLLWFGGEKMLITATDRFRLAEKSLPYSGGLDKKVIVPHKSVLEVTRLLQQAPKKISLTVSDTQISISVDDTYLVTRLIDGEYPPYQQIIPDTHNVVIETVQKELLEAIKTSSVFSSRTGSIAINYDEEKNILQISAVSGDLGESLIDVPADINGGSGVLIVNYRYVLDYLNNYNSEQVTIKVIDDTNPIVFVSGQDDGYLYLVMPIKQ